MFLLLPLLAVGTAAAKVSCPKARPMEYFDFNSYARGIWYEIARYDIDLERGADCVSFEYTQEDDVHLCSMRLVTPEKVAVFNYTATLDPAAGGAAKIIYTATDKGGTNVTLNILYTDYLSYTIYYYCDYDENNKPVEYAWISSKTAFLTSSVRGIINLLIQQISFIQPDKFIWDKFTDKNCPRNDSPLEDVLSLFM